MTRLFWTRVIRLFVVPNIVFLALALPTDGATLIPVLAVLNFALSAGVCVAYAPVMIDIIWTERRTDGADLLAIGIFCAWFGQLFRSCVSIAWRAAGEPAWVSNSDLISYPLYLAICAAVFHLVAPRAIADRAPPLHWIKIGCAVATGVLAMLGIAYWCGFLAKVE